MGRDWPPPSHLAYGYDGVGLRARLPTKTTRARLQPLDRDAAPQRPAVPSKTPDSGKVKQVDDSGKVDQHPSGKNHAIMPGSHPKP